MLLKATRLQRIRRHVADARAFVFGEIPDSIKSEVEKRLKVRKS